MPERVDFLTDWTGANRWDQPWHWWHLSPGDQLRCRLRSVPLYVDPL